MTNNENATVIIEKLLHYLKQSTADTYFQKDLITKISILAEKFGHD